MDDFQRLVYVRLQSLPEGYMISIGNNDAITKEEALEHVKANDEIGKIIIRIDRNYLDTLKSGKLYDTSNAGIETMRKLQKAAEANGVANMTLDEINAEIAGARKEP